MNANGIDPKVGVWFNLAFLVLTGIAAGSVTFAGLSDSTVSLIKTWAANAAWVISVVNTVFALYSAPAAGPVVKYLRNNNNGSH